jgi:hypothetical protein
MVIMYFLIWFEMVICVNLHMVRNGHILYRSAYAMIWYEMVIMCRSAYGTKIIYYDHFVPYAKSYEDSTFILILHHIQINVIPKYMLHVGTVKSMYEFLFKRYELGLPFISFPKHYL